MWHGAAFLLSLLNDSYFVFWHHIRYSSASQSYFSLERFREVNPFGQLLPNTNAYNSEVFRGEAGDGSDGRNNTICTCMSRAGTGQPFSSEGDHAECGINVIKSYLWAENRTHTPNCKPPRWLHSQMPELAKHNSTFTLVWRLESTFSGVCSNSLVIWKCST